MKLIEERIINLETKIRNNDSILSIVSMNDKEKLNFFNRHIQKVIKTDSRIKNNSSSRRGIFRRQKKSQVKFYFYNPLCPGGGIGRRVGLKHQ